MGLERISSQNSLGTCLVRGADESENSYHLPWGLRGTGSRSLDFFCDKEDFAPVIISSNLPRDSVRSGATGKEIGTEGFGIAPCFTSMVEYASFTCLGAGTCSLFRVRILSRTLA